MITNTRELFALQAMSQELPPLGYDYYSSWLDYRAYFDRYRQTSDSVQDLESVSLVGPSIDEVLTGRRGGIVVGLHFDILFKAGLVALARAFREAGSRAPILMTVAPDSRQVMMSRTGAESLVEVFSRYDGEMVTTDDPQLGRRFIKALRDGGLIFIILDAMEGESSPLQVPFLYNPVGVRAGAFKLAQSRGAPVLPLIVNGDERTAQLGPIATAGRTAEQVAALTFNYFSHAVIRRPERWLHWHLHPQMAFLDELRPAQAQGAPGRYVIAVDDLGTDPTIDRDAFAAPWLALDLTDARLYEVEEDQAKERLLA